MDVFFIRITKRNSSTLKILQRLSINQQFFFVNIVSFDVVNIYKVKCNPIELISREKFQTSCSLNSSQHLSYSIHFGMLLGWGVFSASAVSIKCI